METITPTLSSLIAKEASSAQLTKTDLLAHANKIVTLVESGSATALGVSTILSGIIHVCESAKKAIVPFCVDEVSKWNKLEPCIVNGAIVSKTSKGDWDFSECNDDELNTLEIRFEMLKEKVKERKEFLKAMPHPTEITDEETGEIKKVNPAKNNSESIIKITFKP